MMRQIGEDVDDKEGINVKGWRNKASLRFAGYTKKCTLDIPIGCE